MEVKKCNNKEKKEEGVKEDYNEEEREEEKEEELGDSKDKDKEEEDQKEFKDQKKERNEQNNKKYKKEDSEDNKNEEKEENSEEDNSEEEGDSEKKQKLEKEENSEEKNSEKEEKIQNEERSEVENTNTYKAESKYEPDNSDKAQYSNMEENSEEDKDKYDDNSESIDEDEKEEKNMKEEKEKYSKKNNNNDSDLFDIYYEQNIKKDIEKIEVKSGEKYSSKSKSSNSKNNVNLKIKEYDYDDEIIDVKYITGKERMKSSKREILFDKKSRNCKKEIKEEKNISKKENLIKGNKSKYFLKYKEYKVSSYRINSMSFESALKNDKRKYFQIYLFYLINSQIVLNFLLNPNYLELFCLKFIYLIFIIGIEGLFNALLYQDKYINNIYDNNGKYDFFYHFPKLLLSVIFTYVIDSFTFQLITSKHKLQEIIESSTIKNYQNAFESTIKCLKIKIISFFVIDFILTGFSWYYCCVFCALYSNNAKYWLISSCISIIIHLLSPFILCFIPTTLKYCSFKKKNKIIYNINKYLEVIYL